MNIEGFAIRVRGRKVDALLLVEGEWRLIQTVEIVEPERTRASIAFVPTTAIASAPFDPYGANDNEALREIVCAHQPALIAR